MIIEKDKEYQLRNKMHDYFAEWFHVYPEQTSLCGKKRIDLILFHTTDNFRCYGIGLELKRDTYKRGNELGKWLKQANAYHNYRFMDNRVLFPAVYPNISENYLREGVKMAQHNIETDMHHNVNSMLWSAHNIGELIKCKDYNGSEYCKFLFNNYVVWDSRQPYVLRVDKFEKL
jgi:hypothetical protein